jgi:hypothetical protein
MAIWGEQRVQWWLVLFLVPFMVIGLGLSALLGVAVFHSLVHLRVARTVLELSEFPLPAGGRVGAFIRHFGRPPLRRLWVRLVCDEEVVYREGTASRTETKRVQWLKVFEQGEIAAERGRPFTAAFHINLPPDAMHSFAAEQNRIAWSVTVGEEFHGWPRVERHFPVVVNPSNLLKGTMP